MRARDISHFKRICTLAVKLKFHERYLLSEEDFRKLMARSVIVSRSPEECLHGVDTLVICDWECSYLFGFVLGELCYLGVRNIMVNDLRYAESRALVPELSSLMDAWNIIRSTETC